MMVTQTEKSNKKPRGFAPAVCRSNRLDGDGFANSKQAQYGKAYQRKCQIRKAGGRYR
jgi:hypothetical protein